MSETKGGAYELLHKKFPEGQTRLAEEFVRLESEAAAIMGPFGRDFYQSFISAMPATGMVGITLCANCFVPVEKINRVDINRSCRSKT